MIYQIGGCGINADELICYSLNNTWPDGESVWSVACNSFLNCFKHQIHFARKSVITLCVTIRGNYLRKMHLNVHENLISVILTYNNSTYILHTYTRKVFRICGTFSVRIFYSSNSEICFSYRMEFFGGFYLNKLCYIQLAQWYSAEWSRVRVQVGAENFSRHHRVQAGSGAHPASYQMGIRALSLGVKRPGREADHSI
jgi:hypothetical protein